MSKDKEQDIYFDLDTECFHINHGKFVFPKNCAFNSFTADYIDIDKEGKISINKTNLPKIDFCGCTFVPKSFSFADDGFIFEGVLELNYPGKKVNVQELYIGFDGTLKSFKAESLGHKDFSIYDEFEVSAGNSYLTVEQRVSDDGTLSKPLLWQVFEACRMQRHVLKSAELQRF